MLGQNKCSVRGVSVDATSEFVSWPEVLEMDKRNSPNPAVTLRTALLSEQL